MDSTDVSIVRQAMGMEPMQGERPDWYLVSGSLYVAGTTAFDAEVEDLLFQVLGFKGELALDESAEMPHSLSPEGMLKCLAVQILGGRPDSARYVDRLKCLMGLEGCRRVQDIYRFVLEKIEPKVTA